jgi:prolyl-tRNA synthetase
MSKRLPTRAEDYTAWYNELVKKAGLAENAPVRGCMIIKPYGFAIWEKIQAALDKAFKATGHENAYFPLFIPKSYLSREAEHVEGFAKECAVVTHHRLKMSEDGKSVVVDPDAKLEEELIVRPTSETVIWSTYKNWIQSYRDLPLLINQWSNVVRWEMRPRLFLRTTEILWQEGHTAHATKEEAQAEVLQMLNIYDDFAKNYMAVPLLKGVKTDHEKFAGAEQTYTIEALMQDGKALQAGTSHFLGQNFAKAFEVTFANKAGQQEYVWGTSWGVTTRLIGALIMIHSDDEGLVLPPRLAPIQVVMIPIYNSQAEKAAIIEYAAKMKTQLIDQGLAVKLDDRDSYKPGWKFAEYELKGVPVRLAIGPKDLAQNTVEVTRRDTKEKTTISADQVGQAVPNLLEAIQNNLYQRAVAFKEAHTIYVDTYADFKEAIANKHGFVMAHWDGTAETEKSIQVETKATIRCIPLDAPLEAGTCIYSGRPSKQRVLFAQAY